MLSPADAEKTIFSNQPFFPAEDCPLEHAVGRVLRKPIVTDRDFPPFDRVTMDGYAVKLGGDFDTADSAHNERTDFAEREFRVVGLQAAGMISLTIRAHDECVEVATGAMLPIGADTILPYEDVTRDGPRMILSKTIRPQVGQFVHRRGSDHKQGEIICDAGHRLSSREVATAAGCGCASLRVAMSPRIAIVTTGDELVDIANPSPAPHQMRRTNDYALRAALAEAGYARVECVHLRDVEHEIEARIKHIIAEHDVILTTGGVSKGRYDLLPAVFEKLGVQKKLQGIAQRPGKPMWFGVTPRGTTVFALPGNPVSSYICFQRYVIPALAHASRQTAPRGHFVRLAEDVSPMNQLTQYIPVRIDEKADGTRLARTVRTNTSGDFTALVATDGFIEVPPSISSQRSVSESEAGAGQGAVVRYYPWP